MVTAHMWFDPICPWTWLTSRWLLEVEQVRDVRARFHVMSLSFLNEGRADLSESDAQGLREAWQPVRMIAATELSFGADAVRDLYTALGGLIHHEGMPLGRDLYAHALARAGLPHSLANAATNPFYDSFVRASHAAGIEPTGGDVGCPVLHLPGPSGELAAFFGPVVSPQPRGEAAGRLWDAVASAAATEGFFEMKRSRTRPPDLS